MCRRSPGHAHSHLVANSLGTRGFHKRARRRRVFRTAWWLTPMSPVIGLGPQPVRLRTLATFASRRGLLRRGEQYGREERSERHERSVRCASLTLRPAAHPPADAGDRDVEHRGGLSVGGACLDCKHQLMTPRGRHRGIMVGHSGSPVGREL